MASSVPKRINYFEGRLLRSRDEQAVQDTLREAARIATLPNAGAMMWGLTVARDPLALSPTWILKPGGAVDGHGRQLVVVEDVRIALPEGADPAARMALFGVRLTRYEKPVPAPICAGAAAGGRAAMSDVEERVVVDLIEFDVDELERELRVNLASVSSLRSGAASSLFANERTSHHHGSPLLSKPELGVYSPSSSDAIQVALIGWGPGANGQRVDFIDVWAARREPLDPAPLARWRERVRARPLGLFFAEVLQFQAQLLDTPARGTLAERGFVELPPAGYLPVDPAKPLAPQLDALFGPTVDVAVFGADLDEVTRRFEGSRSLDRIPLARAGRRAVDVLFPAVVRGQEDDGTAFDVHVDGGALAAAIGAVVDPQRGGPATLATALVGLARVRSSGAHHGVVAALGAVDKAVDPIVTVLERTTGRAPEASGVTTRPHPAGLLDRLKSFWHGIEKGVEDVVHRVTHEAAKVVGGNATVSMLVDLEADADPLAMPVGHTVVVGGVVVVSVQDRVKTWFRTFTIVADVTVAEKSPNGAAVDVRGKVFERDDPTTKEVTSRPFDLGRLNLARQGATLQLTFANGAAVSVGVDPNGEVQVRSGGATLASLAEDRPAVVASPGQVIAQHAIDALTTTTSVGGSVVSETKPKLFGGREHPEEGVHPHLHWVLFAARPTTREPLASGVGDGELDVSTAADRGRAYVAPDLKNDKVSVDQLISMASAPDVTRIGLPGDVERLRGVLGNAAWTGKVFTRSEVDGALAEVSALFPAGGGVVIRGVEEKVLDARFPDYVVLFVKRR